MPTGDEIVLEIIGRLSVKGMCFDDSIVVRGAIPKWVLWAELSNLGNTKDLKVALEWLHLEGNIRTIRAAISPFICRRGRYKATTGRVWRLTLTPHGFLQVQTHQYAGTGPTADHPQYRLMERRASLWRITEHPHYKLTTNGAKRVRGDAGAEGKAEAGGDKHTDTNAEARALAVLAQHPDWTDARIAEAAFVHRSSLYRWPTYKQARSVAKQAGKEDRVKRSTGRRRTP